MEAIGTIIGIIIAAVIAIIIAKDANSRGMSSLGRGIFILLIWAVCGYAGTEYFPNCEFSCYFPGNPEVKTAYVGKLAIIQKQLCPSYFTLLKAEGIPYSPSSDEEIVNLLNTQARLSNIKIPSISIKKENNLKIGIYSGNVKVAGYNMKIHGKLIVGSRSILHLIVIEQLDQFPSKYAVNFLDSFKNR